VFTTQFFPTVKIKINPIANNLIAQIQIFETPLKMAMGMIDSHMDLASWDSKKVE
jgi:hypothetical protein